MRENISSIQELLLRFHPHTTQKKLMKKIAAIGKSYETNCAAGKIFLTESRWVICPVDVVCN